MAHIKMDLDDKYVGGETLPGTIGSGILTINGDGNVNQTISGSGGITVSTVSGTTTINGAAIGGILPVASGGTGSGVLNTTPVANTIPAWGPNANLKANSFIPNTSLAINGTNTLTIASSENWRYTSSSGTATMVLPDISTLTSGKSYTLYNCVNGGTVAVQTFGGFALDTFTGSGSGARYTLEYSVDGQARTWGKTYLTSSTTGIPIAGGGTGVTSVTTAPTVSAWAGWDANGNMNSNNTSDGLVSRSASATLATNSNHYQVLTGSTASQSITMPVASTFTRAGADWEFYNNSTQNWTIQTSGGNTLQVMAPQTTLKLIMILNSGTTTSSWVWEYQPANASLGTVTSVNMSVPSILSISGNPITSSGTLALSYSGTALPILNGGTGQTTASASFNALSPMTTGGDLIYGGASGAGTRLANGTAGQRLQSNGTTLAPTWVNATSGTVTSVDMSVPSILSISGNPITSSGTIALSYSGTALPILNGGTGQTAIVTAPTASTIPAWDANSNLSAKSFISGYTSQAAANTTLTMTIASKQIQRFSGSTAGQIILLPTTGVVAGQQYTFKNSSTQTLALQSSSGGAIATIASSTSLTVTAIVATPVNAGDWITI